MENYKDIHITDLKGNSGVEWVWEYLRVLFISERRVDQETNRWFGVVSAVMLNSWIRRKEEEGEKLEKLSIVSLSIIWISYDAFEYTVYLHIIIFVLYVWYLVTLTKILCWNQHTSLWGFV